MKRAYVKNQGFTIVELLIVIVVIGVLAAISIVVYGNISARAKVAKKKQDIAQIEKKLEMYRVEKGDYPEASEPTFFQDTGLEALERSILRNVDSPEHSKDRYTIYSRSFPDRRQGRYSVVYWDDVEELWMERSQHYDDYDGGRSWGFVIDLGDGEYPVWPPS